MGLKRCTATALVVTLLIAASGSEQNCEEKTESHFSTRIYKRSPIRCYGRLCTRHWGSYHGRYDYPYPPHFYDPLLFERYSSHSHLGMMGEMKTRLIIKCGTKINVTLPLTFPDRQECGYCDEISLEIKQLHGNLLPSRAFSEFKDITVLSLNKLGITHISEDAFAAQEKCKKLYLSGNNISDVPPGAFNGMKKLTMLDLSHNTIRDLNNFMLNNSEENSINLNLSYNRIDLIEPLFFKTFFKNVSSLNLSFNDIVNINFDETSKNILSLDVSHNHLSRITGCIYKIPKLILSYNNIRSIENLCSNDSLVMNYLDLSHNQISTMNFQTFPDNFNISVLLLQSNIITNITVGTFSNLIWLETLNLSANGIDSLSLGSFEKLGNLKILDLSRNVLKHLDMKPLHSLHSLREFYVQDNIIGDFRYEELIDSFPKLQTINIDNNKFSCDYLIDLVFCLEKNAVNIVYGSTKYTENIHGIRCFYNLNRDRPKEYESYTKKSESLKYFEETSGYIQELSIFWMALLILTLLLLILGFQTYFIHYKCPFGQLENVEMI